jgi:hypothetical protein
MKSVWLIKSGLSGGIIQKTGSMLIIAMLTLFIAPALGQELVPSAEHLVYITEQFPPFNFQDEGLLVVYVYS